MDYKELIERTKCPDSVRGCKYLDIYDFSCKQCREQTMKDCATAIETLLAEWEAAVEELSKRPHHSTCKYGEHCDYISVITGFPDCYSCDEWQWRGPTPPDR